MPSAAEIFARIHSEAVVLRSRAMRVTAAFSVGLTRRMMMRLCLRAMAAVYTSGLLGML